MLRAVSSLNAVKASARSRARAFACPARPSPHLQWKLPVASLSPKNLTAASKDSVLREVKSFDPSIPVSASATPPASWYLSDSFGAAEMVSVFQRTWQLACRADQVTFPGSYVATFVGAEPIVVVRGQDMTLRAFSNVCRHHAARICEGEGVKKELVCPYHSWTYNLEGRLTKATQIKGIDDFRASKVSLPSVRCDSWGPFVFVNLAPEDGTMPFQRPLAEQMAVVQHDFEVNCGGWEEGATGWRKMHHLRRRVYEIGSNWKVYADNYLDGGYHIPFLHLGLDAELNMKSYEVSTSGSTSLQTVKSRSSRVGNHASYAYVFPNLAINKYGNWMDTNLVLPVSPDRCVVVFDWYHVDAATKKEGLLNELDASKQIQDEDVAISESVQSGLMSRSYDKGRYAPQHESAAYAFHSLIHQAMTSYLESEK
jgi:choline monooxygenase